MATDAKNRTTTTWLDTHGRPVMIVDPENSATQYEHDVFGNLSVVRDAHGNETRMTYNIRGMKLTSSDPDLGMWSYDYYPLGELKSQTDAKQQTVLFTYDALSRPLTRVEPEGTTTWTWDTADMGVGRLASIHSEDLQESYMYDAAGRVAGHTLTVDGRDYTYGYAYEPNTGLLQALTYPESLGTAFKVQYDYERGRLRRLKDFYAPDTVFWENRATNARHQAVHEELGNELQSIHTYDRITGRIDRTDSTFPSGVAQQQLSYTWDVLGNLLRREDGTQGTLHEEFEYDNLDRLAVVRRNGVVTQELDYDELGNITSKSGVGAYTYDAAKKHAVIAAGPQSYAYDANGNMISRPAESIAWTSYNLPQTIEHESGARSAFYYDARRRRYKQVQIGVVDGDPSAVMTTTFAGGLFERVEMGDANGYRHYITANGRAVAVAIRTSSEMMQSQAVEYFAHDHLGSIDSMYSEAAAPDARFSHDAWGLRRDWDWDGPPDANDATYAWTVTPRGYTGHDHLDNHDLIHMHGRVYDPALGRFLSPDPFVQAPQLGQALNRYSYVLNNPLRYTDPTGHNWDVDFDIDFDIDFGWSEWFGGGDDSYSCEPAGSSFCDRGSLLHEALRRCGLNSECLANYRSTQPAPTPTPLTPEPVPQPVPQPTLPEADKGVGGLGMPQVSVADRSRMVTAGQTMILPRLAVESLRLVTISAAELAAIVAAPLLLLTPDFNPGGASSALYDENGVFNKPPVPPAGPLDMDLADTKGTPDGPDHDPEGRPRLRRIHTAETIKSSNSSSYNYWRQRSTEEIVRSLRSGADEPLLVKPDGRIYQGNTRILILEERGFDINTLPREILY